MALQFLSATPVAANLPAFPSQENLYRCALYQNQLIALRRSTSPLQVCTLNDSLSSRIRLSAPAGPVKAALESRDVVGADNWGEPISLGTAKIPQDVNLQKLENYLYQWGSNLTQNANLPLPAPIKVDKVDGGVRIGYIRVTNGVLENLVHIDCLVCPATSDSSAIFRALRNGRYKDQVPPGEPVIMQSLLQALRKSIELSKS